MDIIARNYDWARPLSRRRGPPPHIIIHHSVSALNTTPDDIHRMHLAKGFSGIGYHFVIDPGGRVYRGRPRWAIGAHARGGNTSIGVCFIGSFDKAGSMPAAQVLAGQKLLDYLRKVYPVATLRRHNDIIGSNTACPGRYFPWSEVIRTPPAPRPVKPIPLTERSVSVPRQERPRREYWWMRGLLPYIRSVRKQGDAGRVKTGGDFLTIPVPEKRPRWWRHLMRWKKSQR